MSFPSNQKTQAVELGQLLTSTIASVVQAQEKMDQYTEQRRLAFESAPEGSLVLPPLWYVFSDVAIEMELSASVAEVNNPESGETEPHIVSSMLNATNVGLYGYQAASGLKVRLQLSPQGFVPIKNSETLESTERNLFSNDHSNEAKPNNETSDVLENSIIEQE
jgi:hypothetical protein